jgi:MFS family permease
MSVMHQPQQTPQQDDRRDIAQEPSPIRGISRNVFVLSLVSLCTDTSSEMIYPLVPLFLTGVLGAPATVVGLIEGLAEASANVLKLVSGRITDRRERRRGWIFAGYSLSALAKPLLALAMVWPLVLLARLVTPSSPHQATRPDAAAPSAFIVAWIRWVPWLAP